MLMMTRLVCLLQRFCQTSDLGFVLCIDPLGRLNLFEGSDSLLQEGNLFVFRGNVIGQTTELRAQLVDFMLCRSGCFGLLLGLVSKLDEPIDDLSRLSRECAEAFLQIPVSDSVKSWLMAHANPQIERSNFQSLTRITQVSYKIATECIVKGRKAYLRRVNFVGQLYNP